MKLFIEILQEIEILRKKKVKVLKLFELLHLAVLRKTHFYQIIKFFN